MMMKKALFSIGLSLVVSLFSVTAYLFYLYQHREFNPNELEHTLLADGVVERPQISEKERKQIEEILRQPFSYLGRGKQMTAFESADHQYVLKLFNPRPPLKERFFREVKKMQSLLSLKWIKSSFFKKRARLQKLYERYALALRELKEEVGLVYVHLTPSSEIGFSFVEITDRDERLYSINLSNTPFVLQKKAEIARERFEKLLQEKDTQGLQASISKLRELFMSRAEKGITDRIQTLYNNYGFVGDVPIQIDVGRVWFEEKVLRNPEAEVAAIMERVFNTYPDLRSCN